MRHDMASLSTLVEKSGGKPRRLVIGRGFGQSTCKGVSAFVSLTAVL